MMKLGIIGMNEGNGHPFSYSAIFNGYDPLELQKRCPFSLIKEYLPREHRNEVFIDGAKVTHVWTQEKELSEDIARVALIPNVVSDIEDLVGKVDAVILARDDPWNHLKMAEPFLKHGTPLFIDKQLASTVADLDQLLELAKPGQVLQAGSSMRFTRDVALALTEVDVEKVKSVHGVSRVSWMRYGHHLLEGVVPLYGTDVEYVQSLSDKPDHDIVKMQYKSGLNVILEFIKEVQLPIQFTCYSDTQKAYCVPFQDFFFSFREMLSQFVHYTKTGKRPFPYDEMLAIAKIVLAGDLSKQRGGAKVSPWRLQ